MVWLEHQLLLSHTGLESGVHGWLRNANRHMTHRNRAMSRTKITQGKFTVVLRREKEGGYSVQCLELPGAISEGDTKDEALKNIKEAVQGYLEAFPEEADRLKLRKEVVEITL